MLNEFFSEWFYNAWDAEECVPRNHPNFPEECVTVAMTGSR